MQRVLKVLPSLWHGGFVSFLCSWLHGQRACKSHCVCFDECIGVILVANHVRDFPRLTLPFKLLWFFTLLLFLPENGKQERPFCKQTKLFFFSKSTAGISSALARLVAANVSLHTNTITLLPPNHYHHHYSICSGSTSVCGSFAGGNFFFWLQTKGQRTDLKRLKFEYIGYDNCISISTLIEVVPSKFLPVLGLSCQCVNPLIPGRALIEHFACAQVCNLGHPHHFNSIQQKRISVESILCRARHLLATTKNMQPKRKPCHFVIFSLIWIFLYSLLYISFPLFLFFVVLA